MLDIVKYDKIVMKTFMQTLYDKAVRFGKFVKSKMLLLVEGIQVLMKKIMKKSKGEIKQLVYRALVVLVSVFFLTAGLGVLWFSTAKIPDLSSFDRRVLSQSTKIFDRTGKVLLYDLSQNMKRTVIPFENISPNIKKATLAIEDSDFYSHNGIKISSIFRAFLNNLTNLGFSQGGSTITQQVVKNSLLTKEKTITRKVKEIVLAIKLEKALTKDEIFALYLNESPYGGTIYGVEEATQSFFGKSASDITLAESAYIAAIPQAPTHFSPYGKYRDDLEARKNLVLSRMKEVGYITGEEYEGAKNEKVVFQDQVNRGIKAPHFVMYIKQYLEENYGDKFLKEGGLKVITTLDYEMQQKAEEIVKRYSIKNEKESNAENGGLVTIDPKTGDLLVMVGSRDYFDQGIQGNYNVTTARRQPGSSFKPFVYAKAFSLGYTPETVLFDAETQFSNRCEPYDFSDQNGCYSPQNYDGKFRGPISLRNALGSSINVPAVKLLYLVGIQNAIDLAKSMGITTLTTADQYGLSLVLGGGEVTLLDMTGAYSIFANDGVKHGTNAILKIEDKNGTVIEEKKLEDGEQIIDKNVALTISDILSDNVARTPIFGANSSLYFPDRQVAVKTGTTNNFRDAWILGYTPNIAVGAWNGNNDNTPINKKSAGMLVAPMWHEYMNEILKDFPNEPFLKPETKDTKDLKPVLRGQWSVNGNTHSILYWVNKDNPLGPPPSNPYLDPQFDNWEYSVKIWAGAQNMQDSGQMPSGGSSSGGGSSRPNGNLSVYFVRPEQNDFVSKDLSLPVSIRTSSSNEIIKADFFFNGKLVGGSSETPFSFSFIPGQNGSFEGQNELKVVVRDRNGSTAQSLVKVTIESPR